MKIIKITLRLFNLILTFLMLSNYSFSQNFANGSFEISGDSCGPKIPHNTVHQIVPGLYSFGSTTGVELRSNNCPLTGATNPPNAVHGSKYLLFWGYDIINQGGGDSIALKLSSPLIAGQSYQLTYSHRRQQAFTSPVYHIGYSNDSSKFGNYIGLGHCISFSNAWEDTSYTFTPTYDCLYITLKTILDGSLLYLDNFNIKSLTSSSETLDNPNTNKISIYPNPLKSFTTISAGNLLPPFKIELYDVLGKKKDYRADWNDKVITLFRDNLPEGCYLVVITDNKKNTFKLIISNE